MTTMTYDFDTLAQRRGTGAIKWEYYDADVLPMWVADMDFPSPEPVVQALRARLDHPYFGYSFNPLDVREMLAERLKRLYGWDVQPDQIALLSGIVSGLNVAARAIGAPGDGLLVQTPVYPPFLTAAEYQDRVLQVAELTRVQNGCTIRYEIDFDQFEAAITSHTRLFILCNPHNPVGRMYSRAELERLAAICQRHKIVICSDEIHCDLVLDGRQHIPLAALSPEIAQNTITLMAPSKTYNLPGLHFGFAVIQNPDLKKQFERAGAGIAGYPNLMGFAAAMAAYQYGQPWLDAVLTYLGANRDYVVDYVAEHFPQTSITHNEGTYLAWIDWRAVGLPGSPYQFFLDKARVALNDGEAFGQGGAGFTRLNFACPRPLLREALERMRVALQGWAADQCI
jgi:cystathionine beta-lyase